MYNNQFLLNNYRDIDLSLYVKPTPGASNFTTRARVKSFPHPEVSRLYSNNGNIGITTTPTTTSVITKPGGSNSIPTVPAARRSSMSYALVDITKRHSGIKQNGTSPSLTALPAPISASTAPPPSLKREKSESCQICGKTYKNLICLQKHQWEHHRAWSFTKKLLLNKVISSLFLMFSIKVYKLWKLHKHLLILHVHHQARFLMIT
jgi:hypothetical protein